MSASRVFAIAMLAAGTVLPAGAAQAWNLTTLFTFDGKFDGGNPVGLAYHAGYLYGAAYGGGGGGNGTVFKLNAVSGKEGLYRAFVHEGTQGALPEAGPIYQGGILYGTTLVGGAHDDGTVFMVNLQTRVETVLHSFKGYPGDGEAPQTPLVYANGSLYGVTELGGAAGQGAVFMVDASTGAESLVYSFKGSADGANPNSLLSLNGMLYGTTGLGGIVTAACKDGCGTVFAVDPTTKTKTVLHKFKGGNDGRSPMYGLVAQGGFLYGVTLYGGAANSGTVLKVSATTGGEKILASFTSEPGGGLTWQGSLLYGTSQGGVYTLNPATGAMNVVYTPTGTADAAGGTLLYAGGAFYGCLEEGGTSEQGTVFKLTP